ncbi:hypothetical protein [Methylobacterium symbioticum]|uniref:Uncharacterized protein n=1 Tax=Methylobacterium symbioticum TaxID=2584084 RepID=A0A509EBN2_9HYPH|nr:hypothetical protein [Methylobacterium symbioticum]VUD71568.1 hypothetical protein MET9862_02151 [Methylobacterium symbioticum]
MDRLYRGIESGLLGLGFCLSLAAFAAMGAPRDVRMSAPRDGGLQVAVTLPMLSVTADAPH